MAVDVRLERVEKAPWGFRLIGGADYDVPLTIEKVQPWSLAESSGLRGGDVLVEINGVMTSSMTHDAAYDHITRAGDALLLRVARDHPPKMPVSEFQPIPMQDFVPLSQSFEVPQNDRSRTASPFAIPAKPYRPFSTEPIPDIPPLEDPIILNPDYHDAFLIVEDENYLPETKFKLPISEQYVPDGKKKGKGKTNSKSVGTVSQHSMTDVEAIQYMEEMRREIDIEKIEETASHVVDVSMKEVFIVKEEIEKKVDNEVREVITLNNLINEISKTTELEMEESTSISDSKKMNVKNEIIHIEGDHKADEVTINTVNESSTLVLSSLKNDAKTNATEQNETKQSKIVLEKAKVCVDLTTESVAVEENEMKTVEFKESNVNESVELLCNAEFKSDQLTQVSVNLPKETIIDKAKVDNTHDNISKKLSSHNDQKTRTDKTTSKNICTSNLLAEQRAYTLGLQTIPTIRGHVHSSYHYNLLLKTFFIHLTDVMVALSRFILAEPLTNEKSETSSEEQRRKISNNTISKETTAVKTKEQIIKNDVQESTSKYETELIEAQTEKEIIESRKLSGSKLAQLVARKPVELTKKMDAVISEFQEKSQIETLQLEVSRDRRSRSRSIIDEEVAKESDPLEWLEKCNRNETTNKKKYTQNISEVTTDMSKVEEINKLNLSTLEESGKVDEKISTSKRDANKTIYVATVEAHVYTNPDAIIEDMVNISGETVIQSLETVQMNNIIESKLIACEAELSQEETVKEEDSNINMEESSQCNQETVGITVGTKNIQNHESIELTSNEVVQEESIKEEHSAIERGGSYQCNQELIKETANIQNHESIEVVANEVVQEVVKRVEEESILQNNQKYKEKSVELNTISDVIVQEETNIAEESIYAEEKIEASVEKAAESSHELISSVLEVTGVEETLRTRGEEKSLSLEERVSIEKIEMQESTSTEKLLSLKTEATESRKKLSLVIDNKESQRNLETETSTGIDANFDSPPILPSAPPTPLTDEYVFRLEIPLPKILSTTPTPLEDTPPAEDHEDPHIVKKKLVPHIEVNIESVVYDKPLDSPDSSKGESVLRHNLEMQTTDDGAAVEEDLLEIERKSSLLASAIDDTIKSIEMYKEEVGMEKVSKEKVPTEMKEPKKVECKETLRTEVASTVGEASALEISEAAVKNQIRNKSENKCMDSKLLSSHAENLTNGLHDDTYLNMDNQTLLGVIDNRLRIGSTQIEALVEVENGTPVSMMDMIDSTDTKAINTVTNTKSTEDSHQNRATVKETGVESSLCFTSQTTSGASRVTESDEKLSKSSSGGDARAVVIIEGQVVSEQASVNGHLRSNETTEELLGTTQGIVNGIVSEALVDEEVANLGKPGMTEEKIAELISGESEMLREAHVMGLQRVLASHMNRKDDDSSVDFKKIKPTIDSLKDSEVLKVLNEDLTKTKAEKKAEERRWTTFLQRPQRPVPKARFGYYRNISNEEDKPQETYKVKIVKQAKPKVAPDYKPENFETGPLPWEERAAKEPPPPPVPREEPILIPEEAPEYLEAHDPLPESEVPDLEDTGIPLPPEKEPEVLETKQELSTVEEDRLETSAAEIVEEGEELDLEKIVEETEQIVEEMEQNKLADQILQNIHSMVDPSAPLDQQLAQMRAQLAALAVLPGVIQHTLELVTNELTMLTAQDSIHSALSGKERSAHSFEKVEETNRETHEERHESVYKQEETSQEVIENAVQEEKSSSLKEVEHSSKMEVKEEILSRVETAMLVEEQTLEKQKEQLERMHLDQESRQLKQRPTPRVGKPKPVFGPLTPQERPLVLPGGRRWRRPKDAYNDQFIAETLTAQAEIIQGKAKGVSYESVLLPYDERINFMKYEKPPVSLDHLKNSEVYKVVHGMDDTPLRRVDYLTPVIAESDYREKCRSVTPSRENDAPRQLQS